jgi:UDP-N-acetylglucosamine 1-carboxyvinyltransferase
LHGAEYSIMGDRNEEVTFALAAAVTGGRISVKNSVYQHMGAFLNRFKESGGDLEVSGNTVTYFQVGEIKPTHVVTLAHPGFMTDWQAPWAVYMTQANGISTIHETIFESRFNYVTELKKMGAHIDYFDPVVENPEIFYNFNWTDRKNESHHAIKIQGPSKLHNAVLEMSDLRAGATLLIAAMLAEGESIIHGVDQIDRGYEAIDERFNNLSAHISRVNEEVI